MATALRTLLAQITSVSLPNDAGEQQDRVAQLRTQMSSTLQPLLGAAPAAHASYGPAAVPGHAVRGEVAPYQTKEPPPPAAQQPGGTPGTAA